jgi:hypothetical protein
MANAPEYKTCRGTKGVACPAAGFAPTDGTRPAHASCSAACTGVWRADRERKVLVPAAR